MSEIRDILAKKRAILVKMQELEKDPEVKDFLTRRRNSETILDYLTLEEEYSQLSRRENELMGFTSHPKKSECEHPVKLIKRQLEKGFACICVNCGKKVITKKTTSPFRDGILYAQEPDIIDMYSLKREVELNPSLVDIQSKINQGLFDTPSVRKG